MEFCPFRLADHGITNLSSTRADSDINISARAKVVFPKSYKVEKLIFGTLDARDYFFTD